MARRRFIRPQDNVRRGPRLNDQIRISPIRLINEEGVVVGVIDLAEAKRLADEAELDLVEIAADSQPPVCKIMDFGKYKYELSKKEKASKARSKGGDLKEVRLGRSMKIDPHDIEIRVQQARRFLMEGHKVQIVQNFRGREMIHRDRGRDRMADITERLADISKVEMTPRQTGRRMIAIYAPDKSKIDRIKAQLAREKAKTGDSQEDTNPKIADQQNPQSDQPTQKKSTIIRNDQLKTTELNPQPDPAPVNAG